MKDSKQNWLGGSVGATGAGLRSIVVGRAGAATTSTTPTNRHGHHHNHPNEAGMKHAKSNEYVDSCAIAIVCDAS